MIKETAVPPADRLDQIQRHVKNIKFEQDPVLQEFGVSVDTKLHQVDARVLPPPTLVYNVKILTLFLLKKIKFASNPLLLFFSNSQRKGRSG